MFCEEWHGGIGYFPILFMLVQIPLHEPEVFSGFFYPNFKPAC